MGVTLPPRGSGQVDAPPSQPPPQQPTDTGKPGGEKPPPSSDRPPSSESGQEPGSSRPPDMGGLLGGDAKNPLAAGWTDLTSQSSDLASNIMADQAVQTEQADKQETQKFTERDRPVDPERARHTAAEPL